MGLEVAWKGLEGDLDPTGALDAEVVEGAPLALAREQGLKLGGPLD